jgi:uncharacterized protein
MRTHGDIAAFLQAQGPIMAALAAVSRLHAPDCWIGAGLIRNAVWDHLHGRLVAPHPDSDVDVIYFDPQQVDTAAEDTAEASLRAALPALPWSVRNQARMHTRNGDAPYHSTADAVRRWPETATAVAARIDAGRVEILAPHGIDDLVGLIVRPTPAFRDKPEQVRNRLAAKNWLRRWPRLRVVGV